MNRLPARVIVFALCITAGTFAAPAPETERPVEPRHPVRPNVTITRTAEPDGEVSFLGVATVPVPEELRAHIDLAPGAGLMVMFVELESPAAKAGLVKSDILVKLGDQLLVNHDQLSTLIHAAKPGDQITLDIIHTGQPKQLKVALTSKRIEHPRIIVRPGPPPIRPEARPGFDPPRPVDPDRLDEAHRQIERLERQLRESGLAEQEIDRILDRLREQMRRMHELHLEHPRPPHERELHPDRPHREGERPPGAQTQTHMSYTDDDHKLTITVEDGRKRLHAETRDGKELFDGPIDTPEQREKVPAEVREKLERLENQTRIDIRIHPDHPDHREAPREKKPL